MIVNIRNLLTKVKRIGPYNAFSLAMQAGKRDEECQKAGVCRLVKNANGFYYTTGTAHEGDTEIAIYQYIADRVWSYPIYPERLK